MAAISCAPRINLSIRQIRPAPAAAEAGRVCMVVHFTNKEQYFKNAQSPEQHEFYLRWRECMEADPEWIDGYLDRWDSFYSRPPTFLTTEETPEQKSTAGQTTE